MKSNIPKKLAYEDLIKYAYAEIKEWHNFIVKLKKKIAKLEEKN